MMIRCDQAPAVVQGQRQQVHVGQLARAVDVGVVEVPAIEQADVVGPENMVYIVADQLHFGAHHVKTDWPKGAVAGQVQNSEHAVFHQRAGGDLQAGPLYQRQRLGVVHMGVVQQGYPHIHIQQEPHGSNAFFVHEATHVFCGDDLATHRQN